MSRGEHSQKIFHIIEKKNGENHKVAADGGCTRVPQSNGKNKTRACILN